MHQKEKKVIAIRNIRFWKFLKPLVQYLLVLIYTIKECLKTIVERNISEKVKLKRRRIAEIEEEEKNVDNKLFKEYLSNYRSPSDMYKHLPMRKGERNEDQVYVIKKVLDKMKKTIKKVPENKNLYLRLKRMKK